MEKAKFDGFADKYDSWFMANENVFNSELQLLKISLGETEGKKILSVGCGSGLFENSLKEFGIYITDGIEPSKDMAKIAEKRGLKVDVSTIEDAKLENEIYDIIYFNGSSSYIKKLYPAYKKAYDALKPGGKLILLDVPKESAYGIMYILAGNLNSFDHESLEGVLPEYPYPLGLVNSAFWHTSETKISILKNDLKMKNFTYFQTIRRNPVYTNQEAEAPVEGYKEGGYVAIIAEK